MGSSMATGVHIRLCHVVVYHHIISYHIISDTLRYSSWRCEVIIECILILLFLYYAIYKSMRTPSSFSTLHSLSGITRRTIIQIMPDVLGNSVVERRLSLAEFHTADEVFTTGTMGELTPVTLIDGRVIGDTGLPGPITKKIQEYYTTLTLTQGVPLP